MYGLGIAPPRKNAIASDGEIRRSSCSSHTSERGVGAPRADSAALSDTETPEG